MDQETAAKPKMSLDSCRKFLMVVRDFPPGCGSGAKPLPAEDCPERSRKKAMEAIAGSDQNPTMNNAFGKRPMVAGQSSGLVKKMVPRMDGPKKAQSIFLGGKTSAAMIRGPEMARPSQGGGIADRDRDRVEECLRMFRDICKNQIEENKKLAKEGKETVRRVDLHAYKQLRDEGKLVNQNQQIPGQVPGVKIGDTFYYRWELYAVGVHHQVESGIDHVTYMGQTVAASVVASRTGWDDLSNPNELVYGGEGGTRGRDKHQDQQLKGGNLALNNSISTKTPVRVIRKVGATRRDLELVRSTTVRVLEVFIYDGLYTVEKLEEDSRMGYKVYKFTLKRVRGQPPIRRQI